MLAKVYSLGIFGLEAYPVTIEVDVSHALPATVIVGLPDNAVKESKERVRSAIKNSGYQFPAQRITVNLSPADTKKEGPSFDLPIALGLLAATQQTNSSSLAKFVVLGELSLDGQIQPIHGALPMALAVPKNQFRGLMLPAANAAEAALQEDIKVYPVKTLQETINVIQNPEGVTPFQIKAPFAERMISPGEVDFSDVKGQWLAKRALEIAAAGGHNVLMIGPPGSGKTMLAQRLPTILPDMTQEESLETTKIHSVMGLLPSQGGLMTSRPFRSPHHTSSDIALVGGGSLPKPGEITLAHNGVLFLDELPEFDRNVLEALRQPLEDHHVTVSRINKTIRFPSQFMLVAAMNPCLCGQYGNPRVPCRCSSMQIQRYRSKISGPLLDRIDIHLDVPAVSYQELSTTRPAETSQGIKARVNHTRAVQKERFSAGREKGEDIFCNAQMTHRQVRKFCVLGKEESELLKMAMTELNFSARAYDKILKVSRTIADLAASPEIKTEHLAEAIQYRSLDRDWWG